MRIWLLAILLPVLHAETWKHVATIRGPNCGGRTFFLEIQDDDEAVGEFTRLRVQTPGNGELVLTSDGGWEGYGNRALHPPLIPNKITNRYKNLLPSDYIYCVSLPSGKSRRLFLFVTGWQYSTDPASLDVLALDPGEPAHVVLRAEHLETIDLLDLNRDGSVDLVGMPCFTEEWGSEPTYRTYSPLDVFQLPQAPSRSATFSEALSRDYNLKNYHGWAGRCGTADIVIQMPSKKFEKPRLVPSPR